MSVRNSLLAMLATQPTHGYGLKSDFERSTAGAWSLNIGQVYTTLARLERDGLVEPASVGEDGPRQTWRITDGGRHELARWFAEPVPGDPPARDELAIKVLLAVAADRDDVATILERQRAATLERMGEWTRQKQRADPERELPWVLLLDALILKAEAELKWLALCEARLAQRGKR
jgi:DNA-binding PadR family transcriptional regulator